MNPVGTPDAEISSTVSSSNKLIRGNHSARFEEAWTGPVVGRENQTL